MRLSKLYMISIIETMGNDVTFAQRQFWKIKNCPRPPGLVQMVARFTHDQPSDFPAQSSDQSVPVKFQAGVLSIVNHFHDVDLDLGQFCPTDHLLKGFQSVGSEIWDFYFENEAGDPESTRRSEKHCRSSPEFVSEGWSSLIRCRSVLRCPEATFVTRFRNRVFSDRMCVRRVLRRRRKVMRRTESDWILK